MEQDITFGQIVRERRSMIGITQAELARRAGCAPITIRKIESNRLKPSVQLAELIAAALDIPIPDRLAFIQLARQDPPPSPIPSPSPLPGEIGLDDLSGRSIREFQLAEKIGSGGFGVVYRAIQPSVNRDVAIKIILPRYANHPTFIRRFEAEAQLIARIEHPHIVPLYDYWREPDAAYLIMRLIRGGSLDRSLNRGALPLDLFQRVTTQIGEALAAAHHQGVIHRDIKPANILLDENQNAYLADFGIAKELLRSNQTNLTGDGVLIGSPSYISPEQIQDEPVGPYSDIYSFGLLMYEMLTGLKAFRGPTPEAFLNQHLNQPAPSLIGKIDRYDHALDELVQQASAKRPNDRFQNMEALLTAFHAIWSDSASKSPRVDQTKTEFLLSANQIAALDNPYLGLRPFAEADARHFFGRDALVQEILTLLSDGSDLERFAAVVGPSGSGKSSAVMAGLLPKLRDGAIPHSDKWYIVNMTPGAHPLEEIELALLRIAVNPPDSLLPQLMEDSRGLLRAVRRVLPDESDVELLLVIDQFEELFTLVEDEAVRSHLLESLVLAVLDPRSRLRVVITMRADFIDKPLQYVDFGELLKKRLALVLPLTPDELTQAITGPLSSIGMSMSPELLATITREIGDQPGMLPLLQYALTELFEHRTDSMLTLDTYTQIGGITGALAARADELTAQVDAPEQEIIKQLFLRLITLGEGVQDTRRRVRLSELESIFTQSEASTQLNEIINRFVANRLLTFDHDPVTRERTLEVAHEALLREWPTLRGWLTESREEVRLQRELGSAAAQWHTHAQDDGFLLRGGRLTQFEAWQETSSVALTHEEQHFLASSLEAREARQAAEEARKRTALETAQKLAETERERAEAQVVLANSLRQRAYILGLGLIATAVLAFVAFRFAQSSNSNAQLAEEQRDLAQQNEIEALEAASLSLAANAQQSLDSNDQPLALQLSLAANSRGNPPPSVYRTLVNTAYAPGIAQRFAHDIRFTAASTSEDHSTIITGSADGVVHIWDSQSGEQLKTLSGGHLDRVESVAISRDGRYALSGSFDQTIALWDLQTEEVIRKMRGHRGIVSGVYFLPDQNRAISIENTASAPADFIVWDLERGEIVSQFGEGLPGSREGVWDMALTNDKNFALIGQNSNVENPNSLTLWNIETGEVRHILDVELNTISAVAIDPTADIGVAGGWGEIFRADLRSGEILNSWQAHPNDVVSLAISPNGQTILSAGLDQTLIQWDAVTGEAIQTLRHIGAEIVQIEYLDAYQALTVDIGGGVTLWDLTSGWQIEAFAPDQKGHMPPTPQNLGYPHYLDLTLNGEQLVTVGNDTGSELIWWDLTNETVINRLTMPPNLFTRGVTFIPELAQVVTAHHDGSIRRWDLRSGDVIATLDEHFGGVNKIKITQDGTAMISVGGDGALVWDLATNTLEKRLFGHYDGRGVVDLDFLPGEKQLLTVGFDSTLILWDVDSGEQIQRLTGVNGPIQGHLAPPLERGIVSVEVSPSGRLALSGGLDGTIILWDIKSGQPLKRFTGHTSSIIDLEFGPDETYFYSTSQRSDPLIVWDIESGQQIRQIPINSGTVQSIWPSIQFLPDGKSIFLFDINNQLSRWRLVEPAGDELGAWISSNRFLYPLSCAERDRFGIEPLCVDGVLQDEPSDLLQAVTQTYANLDNGQNEAAITSDLVEEEMTDQEFEIAVSEILQASMGDNQGELESGHFDVWLYEGKAGEQIKIELIADNPVTDLTLSQAERLEANQLDTMLFVKNPDGVILAMINDNRPIDGQPETNAQIEATTLTKDGVYRIEARSYLDAGAGTYTLRISPFSYQIDPDLLEEYAGYYIDGPWKYDAIYEVIDNGRMSYSSPTSGEYYELVPINETDFAWSDGTILTFLRDESGQVSGYQTWLGDIHPIGGQFYSGVRLADEYTP